MADRKAELERKKAKLQAMREEKKRKEDEKKKKEGTPVASGNAKAENLATQSAASPAPQQDLRHETEQILADLGIPPASEAAPSPATSRPSSLASKEPTASPSAQAITTRRKVQLTTSKVTQTNIVPREVVAYNKETQTHVEQPVDREDDDNDSLDVGVDTPPMSAHSHKMPHVEMAKPAETTDDQQKAKEEAPPVVREYTDEECTQIMSDDDFHKFFERSSRIIERALHENVDIFVDYTGGDDDKEESGLGEGEKLKLNRQFFDERWSKHRAVTAMDWSTQHPELLVTSYNNNDESPHEPDGVALIWNIKYKKTTPEYVFHCQSAVMSSCFAKFHPNLIVGGTYSGQIVLWDNRSHKKTPVQRTPLSSAAHTHPVYCVNVVGTQNAHNLISISTDGKMCSWSLDMLSQPQDSMELHYKQSRAAAVTSLSFLSGDVNNFVVGSEETAVYTACRHGSKVGINEMFEGHQGPITSIDCHSVPGQIDFSPYFLTSSFDWTIKLWSIKENKYLHSFEDNSDYVYDVRWSPIHPALFSSVDGMGRLDLWNLNTDTEVPTASINVENNAALNKCRWHQNGHNIAVGDDIGRVHIYDVGEALAQPKNDDWQKFVHTLQDMKTNQAEHDDESFSSYGSLPIR